MKEFSTVHTHGTRVSPKKHNCSLTCLGLHVLWKSPCMRTSLILDDSHGLNSVPSLRKPMANQYSKSAIHPLHHQPRACSFLGGTQSFTRFTVWDQRMLRWMLHLKPAANVNKCASYKACCSQYCMHTTCYQKPAIPSMLHAGCISSLPPGPHLGPSPAWTCWVIRATRTRWWSLSAHPRAINRACWHSQQQPFSKCGLPVLGG